MALIVRSLEGSQDLSLAELDLAFDFDHACLLATVYITFDTDVTEEVTLTFVSAAGAEYNTKIDSKVLSEEGAYVFAASGDIAINEGDRIRVQVTNANGVGTAYVTVKVKK